MTGGLACPPCPVCGHPEPIWTGRGASAGGDRPPRAWDDFECRTCGHEWMEFFPIPAMSPAPERGANHTRGQATPQPPANERKGEHQHD